MTLRQIKALCTLVLITGAFACKKDSGNSTPPSPTLPFNVQFKFGAGASPVTIDSLNKTLRNLPAGCNVQQLAATAVLPSGYTIAPDPATVQDYTQGANFTITGAQGKYNVKLTALAYDSLANPYGIYTAKDLSNVRHYLNGYFVLMNDIQLPNMTDANANDLVGVDDYNAYGWYSIGAHYVDHGNIVFRGSIDGQNHVIKNLSIAFREDAHPQPNGIDSVIHTGKSNDGVFGYAIGGRFKNIGVQLAGGIVGVQGTSVNGGVGALLGRGDTCTISNCYVTGTGTISGGLDVGALIGRLNSSTATKCYASISHSAGNFAIVSGSGLIGNVYSSAITSSYSTCDVTGNSGIGGLIGGVTSSTIQSSYASGLVVETPSNGGAQIPYDVLGGLLGTVTSAAPYSTTITNCYALGNVTGATSGNASFLGNSYMGGLVGMISSSASKVTVTNCYAAGAVARTFTNGNSSTPLTGALVGNTFNGVFAAAGGSCSNYWDKQSTTQSILGGGNANIAADNGITANGKTTTEMKTQATYSGWDFTSTWAIDQNKNNGYPYLR
jgi:hypothetical protein